MAPTPPFAPGWQVVQIGGLRANKRRAAVRVPPWSGFFGLFLARVWAWRAGRQARELRKQACHEAAVCRQHGLAEAGYAVGMDRVRARSDATTPSSLLEETAGWLAVTGLLPHTSRGSRGF